MTKFNLGLFLLATASLVQGESTGNILDETVAVLKGEKETPEQIAHRELGSRRHGFHERLGQCNGANCGLWGDPHMITCDGLGYDCQGIGIFQLMKNHLVEVQANFVDISAHEHGLVRGWGLTEGASITNDIMVKYEVEGSPVLQLGFGDLNTYEFETPPSEEGCIEYQYFKPTDMPGQRRSVEPTVEDCRARCARTEGCTKFSWWADGGCHLNNENQRSRPAPRNWPRALAGHMDGPCGLPPPVIEPEDARERDSYGTIGARCPLLFHVDGELQDISGAQRNSMLYGTRDDDLFVEMVHGRAIRIVQRVGPDADDYSEIQLINKGAGPGELWSCHWDFYICLPDSQEDLFQELGSIGLLGSPDGNPHNDLQQADGTPILNFRPNQGENWHKALIDHCYENWCISQNASLMTYPGELTYDDVRCEQHEYVDFHIDNPHCHLSADQIISTCEGLPPVLLHECHLECCAAAGACADVAATMEEIEEITTLSEEPEDVLFDFPVFPACEDDGTFDKTSDEVCPDAPNGVVKLISQSGPDLPDDATLFYGIKLNTGDDQLGRTVKFRVNNPFENPSDIYVKYSFDTFMDPHCDEVPETATGCDNEAAEFQVACHDYDNILPFAVVNVYFASEDLEGQTAIDKCCEAGEYGPDVGVAMYTFEISCACPGDEAAIL